MNKKVVVIGGGYGGLRAVEHLSKSSDIDITLIDKNPYHYLQTEAYGYIAGRFDMHDVAVDLKEWCSGFEKKVEYINDRVTSIEFDEQQVKRLGGSIPYDYLIIATGAQTNFFSFIKGLREHSYGVKKLQRAYNFRIEFENLIYKKLLNEKNGEDINLVIGGAGLSGVEVAAEMAHVIEVYKKTIGARVESIKIYLIDASKTILPGVSEFLIKSTQKRLDSLGVKTLRETFIDSMDDSYIYFRDSKKLKYHFMVFTGGIKAAELNDSLDVEKNKISQFIPNSRLNIGNRENVFAIGDCVEIKNAAKEVLPPTAQTAERSAEYVADAIRKKMDKQDIKPFNSSVLGVFIALGGKYSAGEIFGFIKVSGYSAYLLKKAITKAYYLGLRLRINAGYKNRIKRDI
ncbi:NAD(P)/FAD-dependent oxidoreductase [Sulfurimonas crateris]|uniref:NAD(P)/FAD-dependent oxidoreductase n=1 Tax=Sulfurimonas crateris TaxID=2574727 RepID=A0A4U2Z5C4_9BACT|nr:FAD-dependent oxidoreductase [Sulfurimonas crateris]TKI69496.1 NAD(P)/FAD-dependent oxidoreductase [Sulfurimonas crateris]